LGKANAASRKLTHPKKDASPNVGHGNETHSIPEHDHSIATEADPARIADHGEPSDDGFVPMHQLQDTQKRDNA